MSHRLLPNPEIRPKADHSKKRRQHSDAQAPQRKQQSLAALSRRIHGTVLPKRRRVVRACDRCRKLKIKCSGDIPCIHCTVYSYECTYNHPTRGRRRNGAGGSAAGGAKSAGTGAGAGSAGHSADGSSASAAANSSSPTVTALASANPELLAKLSDRLKLYDDILHRLLPDIKLTDLNDNPQPINPMKLMAALNRLRDGGDRIARIYESLPEIPVPYIPTVKLPRGEEEGISGNGSSAGRAVSAVSAGSTNGSATASAGSAPAHAHAHSSAPASSASPSISTPSSPSSPLGREIRIILPSREVALQLIAKTWGSACVLFRFYHRPAFLEDLNELYDMDPAQYTNKQQRFLPLVYSVLACGALFFKSEERTSGGPAARQAVGLTAQDVADEGYRYFIAARKLIDITDTRDTFGIQTIVMLIIFLQCSARLSTCYAYIGIALRAALREGLHRKLDYPFNPIELETRKRLFWTLYKMDIYVNTMLGLPRTISEDDFDQELPLELDDENITVTGYRYDRQGTRLSSSGIANAHTRLMLIMGHIVAALYPVKRHRRRNGGQAAQARGSAVRGNPAQPNGAAQPNSAQGGNSSARVNNSNPAQNSAEIASSTDPAMFVHRVCAGLEKELQDWLDSLPIELKPGISPPAQYLKANRMLHISYLHVRIILYRPFIHYIASAAHRSYTNPALVASIAKARNCISVARVVVKLAGDMIRRRLLSGSYWFSIYTIFFSVACLVYYTHYAPQKLTDGTDDPTYLAVKKDAEAGKKVLDQLKDSSTAARRTYNILNALFEEMNQQAASTRQLEFVTPQMRWPGTSSANTNGAPSASSASSTSASVSNTNSSARSSKSAHARHTRQHSNAGISGIVNGVNFIDGVSTGIRLEAEPLGPLEGSGRSLAPVTNKAPKTPAASDLALPQFPSTMSGLPDDTATMPFELATPFAPPYTGDAQADVPVDTRYVPGPMDQLDMKIFGRFLPPYMLSPTATGTASAAAPIGQATSAQATSVQPVPSSAQATSAPAPTSGVVSPSIDLALAPSNVPPSADDPVPFLPNSAIPAGLSTVVQSEQEREQDSRRRQSTGSSGLGDGLEDFLLDDLFTKDKTDS